ncbi:two-component system response regulator BtsR [Vibrio rhizosphaerae]|uniref:Two-component system response regulator BtsR n=1 Tax=Vibrio rhizosphaerae TaxID=398736 RepID=A0ABU4IRJ2_9VIBR|nr:two-component system response regulator BtsR [Vibrio rhizosphaerae]MDW6092010.1 two-component system response regulator BtsR [Vibrio rhizosphaerae]
MQVLIIDDEIHAREELIQLLEEDETLQIIGQAGNAIEGLKQINQLKPDVVFLDIQMPQLTGIDLLAMLDQETMPRIVFVTAYDQYAIQAFEDNAFDYLLKPIDDKRLHKTLQRLKRDLQRQDISPIVPKSLEQIPCSGLNRIVIVPIQAVEFVSSDLAGVHVQTRDKKATSQLTLKHLEEKTPLLRCHRQYLIHPKNIQEIKLLENGLAEVVTVSGHAVPVSRRYLKNLKETLGIS